METKTVTTRLIKAVLEPMADIELEPPPKLATVNKSTVEKRSCKMVENAIGKAKRGIFQKRLPVVRSLSEIDFFFLVSSIKQSSLVT